MDDYRKYLAQAILTEDKLVTYRLLSRALKVHVNSAKEMLYDFHKWQNGKKPGSLHATYVVYGSKKKADEQDSDVEMSDSISEPDSPFSDEAPVYTLALVKEEELQDVLQQYDEVTSIHMYSLAPHPLKDLQLLADTAQQVMKITLADDSPSSTKVYGTFVNPNMSKRERRGPKSKLANAASAPKAEPKAQVKQESNPAFKEESKPVQPVAPKERISVATSKKSTGAANLKFQGSSGGIGQMFAKAAAKPKKLAPKPREEEASPVLSDEGEDDTPMPEPKKEDVATVNARRNRQAELRRMMEDSDEEDSAAKADSDADESMEEPEPEPEPEPEQKPKVEEGPSEVVSSTGAGRRRGRRRVMKKKQIMDEKGYLVTIQEQAWESFSEDEAPPPPPKPKDEKVPTEKPAAKGKKGAAKAGQGNIMSFFSKK